MTMSEKDEHIREALEHVGRRPKKAEYHLRKALGEDMPWEVVNGHLFKDKGNENFNKECVVRGCELFQGRDTWEDTKTVAEQVDCPAPMEGIDHRFQSLREMRGSWLVCTECGEIIPPEETGYNHEHGTLMHARDEEDALEKQKRYE